jgi:hypothetical protein
MLSAIRKRLTYTNVAMTLALVFAMTGGAYAANKYLITSTKQISPKVLKALKGASGKSGAAGPAGAQGAQGAQGSQGAAGAKGETGAAGGEGKAGTNGEPGKEGSPWTAGGTLPKGKTLTGEWALSTYGAGPAIHRTAVSFALPLSEAPAVHYINPNTMEYTVSGEQKSTVCLGSVETPEAAAGNLCVYATFQTGLSENEADNIHFFQWKWGIAIGNASGSAQVADAFGFHVTAFGLEPGPVEAYGSWAVTAE